MKGTYILPVIGFIGATSLACAAKNYNSTIDNSAQYKKKYEQQYSRSPQQQDEPEQQAAPQPVVQQKSPAAISQARAQRSLTIEEMLAVKQKIQTADAYSSRNLPGNALVQLLEAQEIAGNSFTDQLTSRVQTTTAALKDLIDVYRINIHFTDQTQSGRAEHIQYALLDNRYTPGIEAVASGGAYTLAVDLRTIEIDEKTKTQRFTILIPTGTMKTFNGEYAALQQTVDIKCADYFARRDAARGAGVQGFSGFSQAINAASSSGGSDVLGIVFGLAKTVDASARASAADSASHSCQQVQEELQATSMFTSDTMTMPYAYTEEVTRKTATAGIRVTLTTSKGTTLFSSPPLDLEFVREDLYRDEVASNNIKGDPKETISDKEVFRGVLQTIPQQVYTLINQGGGLWDVIALQNTQTLTGEEAVEAYVQLYFDAYNQETKRVALDYVVGNSSVTEKQLNILD